MDKRKLILSSLICLMPMLLGIILWNDLPDMLIRQLPGGFSSKKMVVFIFPVGFLALHLLMCAKPDWFGIPKRKRYWHIPIISNVFFVISYFLSLSI